LAKTVAQKLGVHPATVGNWENGRSAPAIHLMPRVIRFLGYRPYMPGLRPWGQRLRAARRAMGLSQKRLARILGVDESTVGRWEAGRSLPRKESVEALLSTSDSTRSIGEEPGLGSTARRSSQPASRVDGC